MLRLSVWRISFSQVPSRRARTRFSAGFVGSQFGLVASILLVISPQLGTMDIANTRRDLVILAGIPRITHGNARDLVADEPMQIE